MARRTQLALLLLAAASVSRAQSAQTAPANPAPCTVAPQPAPCSTTPAVKPSAAERFPFPGEAPAPAAPAANPDPPAPAAPAAKNATPADFPFPGDDSSSASSSSSSSSSSSGDDPQPADTDPSKPALTDKGSEGAPPGRHILHRVNPVGTKLQTDDEREAEDLDIAHFYTQSGDLPGAYLRTQDAVKIKPDDPDAHFALAEVARKLNKRDQAIAEYEACLKLDPDPKQATAARKALTRLNAAPNPTGPK